MCGRYYVDEDTGRTVRKLIRNQEKEFRTGDIHPSDSAVILHGSGNDFWAEDMTWGFPGFKGKSLLINARAETIVQRRAFSDSVLSRRCVIPAKGFYEWSPDKEQYHFEDPGTVLYMAGCFDLQCRFVIITTAANESVLPVHERMPLLISEAELGQWFSETDCLSVFLRQRPQALHRWTRYRQMSLFEQE